MEMRVVKIDSEKTSLIRLVENSDIVQEVEIPVNLRQRHQIKQHYSQLFSVS